MWNWYRSSLCFPLTVLDVPMLASWLRLLQALRSHFMQGKERRIEGTRHMPAARFFPFFLNKKKNSFLRPHLVHFCLHLIGQHDVAWPHRAARKPEACHFLARHIAAVNKTGFLLEEEDVSGVGYVASSECRTWRPQCWRWNSNSWGNPGSQLQTSQPSRGCV